jgi:hypothetical protein
MILMLANAVMVVGANHAILWFVLRPGQAR